MMPTSSPHKSILTAFLEHVEKTPNACALRHGERTLTYAELLEAAARCSAALSEKGVRAGSLVAIGTDRSPEVVVAMLAALCLRAGYLPLDVNLPEARLGFLLRDAAPVLAVGSAHECERLRAVGYQTASFPELLAHTMLGEAIYPAVSPDTREDLAYLMYTSGTTGEPKGVLIPQRGILRLVKGVEYVRLDAAPVILQHSSLAFDAATFEIWGALLNGGTCVLMPHPRPSLEQYSQVMHESGCTTAFFTAALFHELASGGPGAFGALHELLVGGDVVSPEAVRRVLRTHPGLTVIAAYGPTECTTFATTQRYGCAEAVGEEVALGRPIQSTEAYVLDEMLQTVEAGACGDLYLGGDGVALGYLNRPELTANAFITGSKVGLGGGLLYRTGDLAMRAADGTLHFRGRQDRQVKVRGFRVELDGIQHCLEMHPEVAHAYVKALDTGEGERMLLAYATAVPGALERAGSAQPAECTEQWEQVYSQYLYRGLAENGSAGHDPTFNTAGWKSSFDGRAIPLEQMEEQVANTVERILALKPRRVLEIGCGTGMLLFRVAPHCEFYTATDFSGAAIDYLRSILPSWPEKEKVRLRQGVAHELVGQLAGERFDTVILNSVTEHFSSLTYLQDLLVGLGPVLAEGAYLFIGDNRSFPLLRHFHGAVQAARTKGDVSLATFALATEREANQERQLTLDPAFFAQLDRQLFTPVSVEMKRGRFQNEMTAYRFDAVMRWQPSPSFHEAEQLQWSDAGDMQTVRTWLANGNGRVLQVTGVPNLRTPEAAFLPSLLAQRGGQGTLGEFRARLNREPQGVDPEVFWQLGEEFGLSAHVSFHQADPGRFDVLFRDHAVAAAGPAMPCPDALPLDRLANDPEMSRHRENFERVLRSSLQKELPNYAVPSYLIVLPWFPLNGNGKIDAASLPLPPRLTVRWKTQITTRERHEQLVIAAWEKVLGVTDIGLEENFFEIGGNSLSAVRAARELSALSGSKVLPTFLFEEPTVRGLSQRLAAAESVEETKDASSLLSRGSLRRQSLRGTGPLVKRGEA